ncbi:EAL domain-containing protein [Pseudidiomarina sp. 1APR75-33.1]|uniref:putative bifunctional diguanylate cyclase/phosphodiesterase n=1 Tax=Pseudidiomarina terrestris TaxID=2820060 RepID=UPI0026529722|nr:EAL domain-containing protein [Pseudidiomarina sp. 1APR75-33.1]MDN7127187.1 EAL domain-containing protein [Pseudidiomarina sp. 1APR75-33.1]
MIYRRSLALSLVNVTLYVTISATFLFGLLGLAVNLYEQPGSAFERVISTTSGVVAIAVAFALFGLAAKRRLIQIVFAAIVVLAALHSLIVNLSIASIFYLDFLKDIDAHFYPPVALAFLLLGITLMLNPRERIQRRWMRTFASFLVVLALTAMGLHFADNGFAYLGPHPPVTSLASLNLLLIGVSLLLSSSSRVLLFRLNNNPAAWITFAFVAIICCVWFNLSLNHIKEIRAEAFTTIEKVAKVRQQTIQVNIQVLSRLRERWHQLGVTPTSDFAKFDVATYLRDIPHYLGIHLLDNRGVSIWEQHRGGNDDYNEHLNHPQVQNWLASEPNSISMLVPRDEFRLGKRPLGLMLLPVGYEADRGYYLLVVFDLMQLVNPETRVLPNYLKVYAALDDDRVISFSDAQPPHINELSIAEAQLHIPYGEPLQLSVSLYSFDELSSASNLRMLVATLGFLFCIAFLALAQQNKMLTNHSRRLNGVRAQLQHQQKQLLLNEQQYSSLFFFHPDAVFSLDREGMVTSANQAVLNILHTDEDQVLNAHYSAFILPADRAYAEAHFQRTLRGETCRYDLRGFASNGEVLHIHVTNLPIKINGEITGVFGIARDITAQKEQDEQLHVLKRSVNVSTNGIVISDATDPSNPVIYANEAFTRMTGYEVNELVGSSCDFLIGEDTDPDVVATVRKALVERTECKVRVLHYHKDGSSFWDELQLAPVADAEGTITHFVGVHQDITERVSGEHQLAFQAEHDALTELLNRYAFERRLSGIIEQQQHNFQRGPQWVVLFIDLDGFKPINEAMGLAAGDQVLKQVADRLAASLTGRSFAARFGGDEFVIATKVDDLSAADALGHYLLAVISEPYPVRQQKVYLTASIGVAVHCGPSQQAVDLIQQADTAMSLAKRQGRNHLSFYQAQVAQKQRLDVNLRNQFQQAIDQERLELFYQPIVDLQSGKVVAAEALMRWQIHEGEFIPPAKFIPMAETTGQIIPASQWGFARACKDLQTMLMKQPDLKVCVNLSAVQFSRADFIEQILATIKAHDLANAKVELELTESVLMDDSEHAIALMNRFRQAGLSMAIDDFGTGFSSLSYLKKLPLDKLKIDRAFIQDIISKPSDEAIVRGILAVARQLNIEVVAEGIETKEQAVRLAELGCNYGQGFYFAKPMPLAEFMEFLA